MTRKLASIQVIKDLRPIPNSEFIECAEILGWTVVVKKGEFKVGDKCVFFEIDSLIPRAPWNDFLSDKNKPNAPIRLKSVRLRGQLSQGLAIPISVFGLDLVEGEDVTEKLGVEKYEPQIPAVLSGLAIGSFPGFIHKTDELRVQSFPGVMEEMKWEEVVVTLKMDGSSSTLYKAFDYYGVADLNVCSRELRLKEDDKNTFWRMARKYNLSEKLPDMMAIQGECFGPGIQSNRMGVKENDINVFNVYDIRSGKYLDFGDAVLFCNEIGVPFVPVVYRGPFKWNTVEELIRFAGEQWYDMGKGLPAEGIVIRPVREKRSEVLGGRLSFKVISNVFLLKYGKDV